MKGDKKKLASLSLDKLNSLYLIVSEICADFSKMTDNYSLVTGDNKFEHVPSDFSKMISDRQKFISYRLKIKDALIEKVNKEMDNYE